MKSFKAWIWLFVFYVIHYVVCYDEKKQINNYDIFSKYIGKGYDILFGYPLPNNEFNEDPGFREKVFDAKNAIDVINDISCSREEYLNVIEGIYDVANLALENVSIDDLDTKILPFSGSVPYIDYFSNLEIKKKKYAYVQNTCLHNYATLNLNELTKFINNDFLLAVNKLPILSRKKNQCTKTLYFYDSNNKHCSKTIKPWVEFFQTYGTHVLVSARFGGKTLNTIETSIEKTEEIKIYKYNYSVKNIPYLNIMNDSSILQKILNRKINQGDLIKIKNKKKINTSLDIRNGDFLNGNWNELTFEIWKNNIYSNLAPIYLELISLNSFISTDKKDSYNIALLHYNNLYGINKENFYLSQNISNVLSEGKQVTGAGKGSLILNCPSGYIKSTGFIFSYDASENIKNKIPKVNIFPCKNNGGYDVTCAYTEKNDNIYSFGWIYCVKHSFIKFETLYNQSHNKKDKSFEIKCSEGNVLAFGFTMELKKKKKLDKLKVIPCEIGKNKCSIDKNNTDTNYLLWGFCVPISLIGIHNLQLTYIGEKNLTQDVRGACTDDYKNKNDNIFIGFTFSFDKTLELKASSCKPNSKYCVSKINNTDKKHYVGMFLLCRHNGNKKGKFQLL